LTFASLSMHLRNSIKQISLIPVLLIFFNCSAQPLIDSLEKLLPVKKDTDKIQVLIALGDYLAGSDNKKSLGYLQEAYDLSKKLNYTKGLARVYFLRGIAYYSQSDYQLALENYNSALELYTRLNDKLWAANLGVAIGTIYDHYLQYDKELDEYFKSLKIFEEFNNEDGISACMNNIGSIYSKQKKYIQALEFYLKSLQVDKKNNRTRDIAESYINIASLHGQLGQYNKEMAYCDSAVPLLKSIKDNYLLTQTYNEYGMAFIYLKNYTAAYKSFQTALHYSALVNNPDYTCIIHNNLGRLFLLQGKTDSAKVVLEKNIPRAKKINSIEISKECYFYLTCAYENSADYRNALEYFKIYKAYSDSIDLKNNSDKLLEMQTRYEVDNRENQIKLLNKDNELKNTRLMQLKIFIAAIAITLLLAIVLAVMLFNRFRIKRKANELLQLKNLEIEKQKQEILTINDQLSAKAEELKELDQVKSRFFTNISHEFRTPLTLIIGPLEVMLPDTTDNKIRANYEIMLRQAKRLLNLVNQLLELSKLEKGAMCLALSEDDFNRFVRTLTTSYSSLAAELKIDLNFTGYDTELNMWFDKDKVEKIVTNILTNAFKFTDKKGKIDVILRKAQKEERLVEIIIRDNGAGIEPENLKHIFDPFYQVSSSAPTKFQGSGIGLALVKELIKVHHGTITVQSKPGNGSEFVMRFPIEKSVYREDEFTETEKEFEISGPGVKIEESGKVLQNTKTGNNTKEQTLILIVEDNEDMRKYITGNLPVDYRIIEAGNGEEGIEKANKLIPDLIIADIMMPRMDGIGMVKILKKDERTSHVPVIFLTAKASEESIIEGLETRADDYITKPFNIHELTLKIQNLIYTRSKLREKFMKSITVVPSEITSTSVDQQFLQKVLQIMENHMDDHEYNAEKFSGDVGMSRSNLHRKLVALTSQSTTEFMRSIRVKRAAQLLSGNVASISEIAYQTGFSNLSWFTKCFKEQFGKTPSEFLHAGKDL
jgi:signal transduction histidine kinase/DNA-binding response OmpR family regulator